MTTLGQAQRRARTELRAGWTLGTFYVAPWAYEDEHDYLVIVGAREHLVDDDDDYVDTDGLVTLVDKATGKLVQRQYLDDAERYDAMTPCGAPNPWE